MNDYECHITMLADQYATPDVIKGMVEQIGWKYSAIDGDPTLGKGVKCYATNHFGEKFEAILSLETAAINLRSLGATIIRKKVEHVIYDIIPTSPLPPPAIED